MSYDMRDLRYLALRFRTPLGASAVKEILESCVVSSYREIWDEDAKILRMAASEDSPFSDITRNSASGALSKLDDAARAADTYAKVVERLSMDVISQEDDDYPYAWRQIPGMPKVFFAKGVRSVISDVFKCGAVAVVGSRHPGRYAVYATQQMVKEIAAKGIITVSGMALGIDREAHLASLENGSKTIGIMPAGLDIVYPYQNADIYDRICESGVLISEMPPGQKVLRQYFPARNRLIAALSDAVMVMEAGEHSGTLHTASFAASQGKPLFVLPNNIYAENSLGALKLIKDGADVLLDPSEVIATAGAQVGLRLYEAGLTGSKEDLCDSGNSPYKAGVTDDGEKGGDEKTDEKVDGETKEKNTNKRLILDELSIRDMDIGSLSVQISMDYFTLAECLAELELDGRIETRAGKYTLTYR